MIEPSIEDLILAGVVEVAGIDSTTGEFLYNFTDKLQGSLPEVYTEKLSHINEEVFYFLDMGFLDLEESGPGKSPLVFLTNLAFDDEAIAELTEEKQRSLIEIKKLFEK